MEDRRVLVTGGAGFIGSNLANTLALDNDVVALDNGYLGTPDNLDDGVEYVEADVLDDGLPTNVDVVFHLAALSSRQMLEENPREGARVNIEGFVNVVEQARGDGCDTVVYASTSSAYGSRTEPSPEDMDLEASTGYDASMLGRERYAEYYNDFYDDLTCAGARFFSVYQGYGGAEAHKGEYANTVSQFTDQIADGEAPVLWGDGSQTRDFTHVDDIVRGLEAMADHDLTGVYKTSRRAFAACARRTSTKKDNQRIRSNPFRRPTYRGHPTLWSWTVSQQVENRYYGTERTDNRRSLVGYLYLWRVV